MKYTIADFIPNRIGRFGDHVLATPNLERYSGVALDGFK